MKNRRSGRHGVCALKLDMMKAYDRVEWPFLKQVMLKMRFASVWVQRVMHFISSTSLAVMINGKPCGDIRPTRGLRQGDPISPLPIPINRVGRVGFGSGWVDFGFRSFTGRVISGSGLQRLNPNPNYSGSGQ